uniref:Uncharacterized protein n=1 Tax=Tetranychus urticae TaxID=32264 RepID=T1KP67_TETUR
MATFPVRIIALLVRGAADSIVETQRYLPITNAIRFGVVLLCSAGEGCICIRFKSLRRMKNSPIQQYIFQEVDMKTIPDSLDVTAESTKLMTFNATRTLNIPVNHDFKVLLIE